MGRRTSPRKPDATEPAEESSDGETCVFGACEKEFDSREDPDRHVHDVGIVD